MAIRPDVVAPRARIADATIPEQREEFREALAGGRAVTNGYYAKDALERIETAIHFFHHRGKITRLGPQMPVAVVTDLMAGLEDGLTGCRMRLGGPSGDEESRLDLVSSQKLEQLRNADTGLVSPVGHGDEAIRIAAVHAEPDRLGVDVEARKQGAPFAVRPGIFRSRWSRIGWAWSGVSRHGSLRKRLMLSSGLDLAIE
jgi:hypothetical protein